MTKNSINSIIENNQQDTELLTIERVNDRNYYPLSNAQERLWIVENLSDNNTQYNIVDAYTLFGELDVILLQKSLNQVISRHETLRTSIIVIGGRPKQYISDDIAIKVDFTDLCNSENKYDEAKNIIHQDCFKSFDLEKAPLIRLKLFKVNDQEHILYFNFHHIISDGWSIDVFFTEMFHCYMGGKLENPKVRYRDYVNWQFDIQKSYKLVKSENYWINLLSDNLPELSLKSDFSRPSYKSFSGLKYEFSLEKDLTEKLKIIAQNNQTTLFSTLMAVYNILLSYKSEQDDIVIGFPVAGRNHPDLAALIGMFVNTVVIRNNCQNNLTFQSFLRQVKDGIVLALEHQEYPFENLVKKIDKKRNSNRNPIFDAMLTFQNYSELNLKDSVIHYKSFDIQSYTAWFDIIFDCVETEGEIKIKIIFDDKLFKIDTIKHFAQDFVRINQQIVKNLDSTIFSIKNTIKANSIFNVGVML